jgi:hypothetical protein
MEYVEIDNLFFARDFLTSWYRKVTNIKPVDEALLRKRSEHNDGELSTLKEVALHQYDIEKIENLDVYCRNLEILYLQSNQITKIGYTI